MDIMQGGNNMLMSNIDRFKVRVWDKDTNKFLDEND